MAGNRGDTGLIARRIRQARQQAGLTQGQIAVRLGLHRPTVSEIEAGRRQVTASELRDLADVFGVRLSWLAGEHVEPTLASDELRIAARDLMRLRKEDFDKVVALIESLASPEESRTESGS